MDHKPRSKKSNKAKRNVELHGKFSQKHIRQMEELKQKLCDNRVGSLKQKNKKIDSSDKSS